MDFSQAFFLYTALIKVADVLTVLGLWFATWYVRFGTSWFAAPKGVPAFSRYADEALPLVLIYSAVFHVVGVYRRDRIEFGFRPVKKVVQGSIMATLVFLSWCYFQDAVPISRVFLLLFAGFVIAGLLVERALLGAAWAIAKKKFVRRVRHLLIGSGELLSMYVAKLDDRRPYPLEWVGRLGAPEGGPSQIRYLGEEERLSTVLAAERIDMAVVAYPTDESERYEPILKLLSNELVGVKVLPDFGRFSTFTYQAQHECGIPLLVFNQPTTGATDRVVKRLLDGVGAFLLLVLFSPLMLLIALLIKLTSRGPVLYSQVRMGIDGKVFDFYKFRSMRTGAEARTGAVWAKKDDDRVTPLGRWLRRTSLDELPQFYNVLRGDMSLVGPRPERPVFVDKFRHEVPRYMLRHRMKSGITGWAQVNGWRGDTSIDERIKHDLYYIGHWSHLFDIKILCLTLVRGFIHRNAY